MVRAVRYRVTPILSLRDDDTSGSPWRLIVAPNGHGASNTREVLGRTNNDVRRNLSDAMATPRRSLRACREQLAVAWWTRWRKSCLYNFLVTDGGRQIAGVRWRHGTARVRFWEPTGEKDEVNPEKYWRNDVRDADRRHVAMPRVWDLTVIRPW